jgi:hypothetical protein
MKGCLILILLLCSLHVVWAQDSIKTADLKEVVIKGKVTPVVIKGDTTEYRADHYKMRPNAVVEDLLKRLPGMQVDASGNITFMGKKVSKIRVNGKDFMVDDIKSLTGILPVDLVNKIQIINDYGYMARATGRRSGDPEAILNIQTKSDMDKIYHGKAVAGMGNDGRHDLSVIVNNFSADKTISIGGNTNNTSSATGKVTTSNVHANYRKNITKAFSMNTGLSASHSLSSQLSSSTVQTVTSEGTLFSANNDDSKSTSNNYAFSSEGEYHAADDHTHAVLELHGASGSSENNNIMSANQTGFQHKDQLTSNYAINNTPSIGGSAFGMHRFKGTGRTIAFRFMFTNANGSGNQDSYDSLRYYNADNTVLKDSLLHQLLHKSNNDFNTTTQLSYVHPIDSLTSLEIRYTLTRSNTSNKLETRWVNAAGKISFIDSLSNQYAYTTTQQQLEINFHKGNYKHLDYTLGVRLQPSVISGQLAVKRSVPVVPVFDMQYRISDKLILASGYSGNVGLPTYQQLLPVKDLTNAQFPVIGNPDLKTSFVHSFSLGLQSFGELSLFLRLFGNYTKDNIVTNVVLVKDSFNTVKQETHFLNADGTNSSGLIYNISKQFDDGKYELRVNGSGAYNNNVLFLDNIRKTSQSLALSQSVSGNMMKEWLELSGNVDYSYNRNVYALAQSTTTNITTWSFGLNGRVFFLKTFSLRTDLSKQINTGYIGGSTNPVMLNSTLEKTFFKDKLTLRLQGINLLDEVASLSQSISGNTITQSRSQLAGRYFILSLQCDLKMFGHH